MLLRMAVILLFVGQNADSQLGNASLQGVLSDQSGAVVAKMKVWLKAPDGTLFFSESTKDGRYSFVNLKAGKYELQSGGQGFDLLTAEVQVGSASSIIKNLLLRVPDCHGYTSGELKALPQGIIIAELWGGFGVGHFRLQIDSAGRVTYSSEAWDAQGKAKKVAHLSPQSYENLLSQLQESGVLDLDECQGGRGIDSGQRLLVVAYHGRIKQLVIGDDAPAALEQAFRAVVEASGLLDSRSRLKRR
jgi:hypothetical protein